MTWRQMLPNGFIKVYPLFFFAKQVLVADQWNTFPEMSALL